MTMHSLINRDRVEALEALQHSIINILLWALELSWCYITTR